MGLQYCSISHSVLAALDQATQDAVMAERQHSSKQQRAPGGPRALHARACGLRRMLCAADALPVKFKTVIINIPHQHFQENMATNPHVTRSLPVPASFKNHELLKPPKP